VALAFTVMARPRNRVASFGQVAPGQLLLDPLAAALEVSALVLAKQLKPPATIGLAVIGVQLLDQVPLVPLEV